MNSGLDYTRIEIEVNEKKDTSDLVRFIGLPYVGKAAGFRGMSGAATVHPKSAGLTYKLRLIIDGKPVETKYRRISNSIDGYAFYLSADESDEMSCSSRSRRVGRKGNDV